MPGRFRVPDVLPLYEVKRHGEPCLIDRAGEEQGCLRLAASWAHDQQNRRPWKTGCCPDESI